MNLDLLLGILVGVLACVLASTFSDGLPNTARWLALKLRCWAIRRELYRERRQKELELMEREPVTIPEPRVIADGIAKTENSSVDF